MDAIRMILPILERDFSPKGVVPENTITTKNAEAQFVAGSAAGRFRAVFLRKASVARKPSPIAGSPVSLRVCANSDFLKP